MNALATGLGLALALILIDLLPRNLAVLYFHFDRRRPRRVRGRADLAWGLAFAALLGGPLTPVFSLAALVVAARASEGDEADRWLVATAKRTAWLALLGTVLALTFLFTHRFGAPAR